MSLADALGLAAMRTFTEFGRDRSLWQTDRPWITFGRYMAGDPAFREALTAALAEAMLFIPIPATYEEWQAAMDRSIREDAETIVAHLLPDAAPTAESRRAADAVEGALG